MRFSVYGTRVIGGGIFGSYGGGFGVVYGLYAVISVMGMADIRWICSLFAIEGEVLFLAMRLIVVHLELFQFVLSQCTK